MNLEQMLLIKLMEECAEVQQICAKALRFGTKESRTCESGTNIQRLEEELMDVVAVISKLTILGTINVDTNNEKPIYDRIARIDKYMEYSRELGILK